MDATVTVHLTLTAVPTSPRIPLDVARGATSSELRLQVAEVTKIPLSDLRLIFRGRLIGNDDGKSVVEEYKIEDKSVIHCMGKPEVGESAKVDAGPASEAGSGISISKPSETSSAPPSLSLDSALSLLRSANSSSTFSTAVNTLAKIVGNIASHPMEEKYRRVKLANAAFQRRLGGLSGGDEAMRAVGFVLEESKSERCYVMHASPDAWPKLMESKIKLENAVNEVNSAGDTPVPPSSGAGMQGSTSALPSNLQATVDIMSNPAQLQAMLQNPMVQQIMQNDPRFSGNPMVQNSIDQLASNPQLIQQLSEYMRDPGMRSRMQNLMSGSTGPAMQPGAAQAVSSGQNEHNQGQSDEAMTEEEMLQEAIQRSLRES